MVPSQNTEPGTDLASSSTSDPQTNTLQNINSVIQQNQLQVTISFESLLLDKVNKHPKPVPSARRRIDGHSDDIVHAPHSYTKCPSHFTSQNTGGHIILKKYRTVPVTTYLYNTP
nr:unnamed protein product [Callosobruchus analis]